MIQLAPASRAAAADKEPLLPAAPRIATTGPVLASAAVPSLAETTRRVSAGAPQTSMTDNASGTGRSSGRTAAIDRANKVAVASHGTCSDRPSQLASPSWIASGVSVSDTSVATRSPGFRPRGDRGPASVTTPVSMPPEPVTGLCILPRLATISQTAVRIFAPSPPLASCSCR
jgi:hypothetical protein